MRNLLHFHVVRVPNQQIMNSAILADLPYSFHCLFVTFSYHFDISLISTPHRLFHEGRWFKEPIGGKGRVVSPQLCIKDQLYHANSANTFVFVIKIFSEC